MCMTSSNYYYILIMTFETFSSRGWKSTSGWCTRKDSNFKYCKICAEAKMSKESHCQNFQTTGLILGFRLLYSHSQESKCKDLPVFSVLDVPREARPEDRECKVYGRVFCRVNGLDLKVLKLTE